MPILIEGELYSDFNKAKNGLSACSGEFHVSLDASMFCFRIQAAFKSGFSDASFTQLLNEVLEKRQKLRQEREIFNKVLPVPQLTRSTSSSSITSTNSEERG